MILASEYIIQEKIMTTSDIAISKKDNVILPDFTDSEMAFIGMLITILANNPAVDPTEIPYLLLNCMQKDAKVYNMSFDVERSISKLSSMNRRQWIKFMKKAKSFVSPFFEFRCYKIS